MFDPALAGYWGHADHDQAMEVALAVIAAQRRQGRRHQDLAARQGQGNRHAPAPAAGRAHVHRRRLQLRRADRRRRRRAIRTRCWASSTRSRRRPRRRWRRWRKTTARRSTKSSRRPCRCRATSSARRRASTRPAWCSWAGSTAIRTTSSWSAASRARARILHLAELFRLADAAGLLRDPELACARHEARCLQCTEYRLSCMSRVSPDPDLLSLNTATVREKWSLRADDRGLRAPRHPRHLALARQAGRARREGGARIDPRRTA